MKKCENCGKTYASHSIFKNLDLPRDQKWNKDNINWKNVFIPDWVNLMYFVAILILIFGANKAIADCDDAINDPCKFCDYTGCCELRLYEDIYRQESDAWQHNISQQSSNVE